MNWRGRKAVSDDRLRYAIAYLPDERVYAEVIVYGSYASKVRYIKHGIECEVVMLNEDFEIIEEANIEIEEEY